MRSIHTAIACFAFLTFSCKKNHVEQPQPEENKITFSFKRANGTVIDSKEISVSYLADSIQVKLPPGTYLKDLIPEITFTGKSVFPKSGVNQNFSAPVTYSVTANDGSVSKRVVDAAIMQPTSIVYVGTNDGYLYALQARTGKKEWEFKADGSFAYSSPTYKDGIIYEGSIDNYVYAINSLDGSLIWKQLVATTGIESDAICVDSTVYVGTNDDYMLALDAITGNERWRFQTGSNISSSPLASGDTLFFGSSDSYFYALNRQSGSLLWKFNAGDMINQCGASLIDGILYFGSRNGSVYAVDAKSGNQVWEFQSGGMSFEMSSPTVKDGVVYIGGWYNVPAFSLAGSVYAINAATGSLIWEKMQNTGFSSSPYVVDGKLYITGDDLNITALNTSDGSLIWKKEILPNSASAVVAHGIVYVGGCGTGYIYALDANTGNEIWKFSTPGFGGTSSPLVIDNVSIPFYPGDSGILD